MKLLKSMQSLHSRHADDFCIAAFESMPDMACPDLTFLFHWTRVLNKATCILIMALLLAMDASMTITG